MHPLQSSLDLATLTAGLDLSLLIRSV